MTVLVVDHTKMAGLLRRGLDEAGFAVELAESGEVAVARSRQVTYEAIVLEVGLAGIDGVEACRRLRAGGYASPILLVSALAGTRDREAGLAAGADAYLVKPFSLGDLTARLHELVGARIS